ncbi:MAG TPA: CHAT domain-containing protein, partial [Isosphaeraceae bacterium]|nr:CHAT domain-containing protein [Isosphaeraceae bacterium]
MAELPVIVLAFANEQEGRRYLRDLPEELRQLQAILEAAEGKRLCKLVVRPNARLDQILETFTEHRERVAILHYGGHAGGDRLFLETTGTESAVAHAEGLATFLGQRRNLQLVFLNGCSTRAQAAGLLDAGVAAVIATARAIEDAIALEFAAAFYSEVASGQTLRAAYEAARGRVLAGRGSAPQAYFRTRDLGTTDHVPVDPA